MLSSAANEKVVLAFLNANVPLSVTKPKTSKSRSDCASIKPPSLAAISKVSAVPAKVKSCEPLKSRTALPPTAVVWFIRKLVFVAKAVSPGMPAKVALPIVAVTAL